MYIYIYSKDICYWHIHCVKSVKKIILIHSFSHMFSSDIHSHHSPKTVSTLRGSYGKCKGAPSGWRRFSWEFSHDMALLRCASAFQLRKLAQNVRLTSGAIGARHFWWKFSNKIISIAQAPTKCAAKFWGLMARLRRPSAFRLCRLAQNVRLTSGANFSGAAFLLQILE